MFTERNGALLLRDRSLSLRKRRFLLLLHVLRYWGARFTSSPAVYGDVSYAIALVEEIFVQHG